MIGVLLAVALPIAAPNPPPAVALYTTALRATRSAPQPTYATYRTDITSRGLNFALTPTDGVAQFAIGPVPGAVPGASYDAKYAQSGNTVVAQIGAQSVVMPLPLFNPTWGGIAEWMHYGFDGAPYVAPSTAPSADVSPAPHALLVIADVVATSPEAYAITDGGATTCENGAPARRLLMRALRDPQAHPLTSVVVDSKTQRFCTMYFQLDADSEGYAVSLRSTFEVHLGDIGGNWLVSDGTAEIRIHTWKAGNAATRVSYRNSNFAFPTNK